MGVIVLGMHRSGTSAVTRAINAFGVPLGNPADAIPPSRDNPEGFAESIALADCNDQLLGRLGGRWDAPPDLPPGWEVGAAAQQQARSADQTFRDVYATHHWVWKDPRLCLTWPFWDRLLGGPEAGHRMVLVVREPRAVARSLGRRDRLTKPYALALWERYARAALACADRRPTMVAGYDRLMAGRDAVDEWVEALGPFLDGEVDRGANPGEAAGLLKPTLDHRSAEARPFDDDPETSPSQRALYHALLDLPMVSETFVAPPLPPETRRTAERFAEHRGCGRTGPCSHRKLEIRIPGPPGRQ